MKCVLVLSDYFIPGYKAGGQIRTLANFSHFFGDKFDIRIITHDREIDGTPYEGIIANEWVIREKTKVIYLSPSKVNPKNLLKLIREVRPDVIYHNGFFSFAFTAIPLILRKVGFLKGIPVILPPRGEFSNGALIINPFKKRLFIGLAKSLRLYKNIIWQASSEFEREDIIRVMGEDIKVLVANDLPTPLSVDNIECCEKISGSIRLIYLSRISRIKNLHRALQMIQNLKGLVKLSIYGLIEDRLYWEKCNMLIMQLPSNIMVEYMGVVSNEQVISIMANHHFLILPTLGENYGYVILEALIAGCPVIISDRTPWKELQQKGIGWEISLDDPEGFETVLQQCVNMDNDEYQMIAQNALKYGAMVSKDKSILENTLTLFEEALNDNKLERFHINKN